MDSTDNDELDPPNDLVDGPCMPGDMISTGRPSSAASRANSIGTLTSWQLLAKQVGNDDDEEEEQPKTRKQAPPIVDDLACSPRSSSWTSGTHRIAPRPHHALYKEYRLLETIGKGAFGTVSIAIRRADGKQLVAKEISQTAATLASAKQREAIMDEVNVLARMKHPNIVKYHDCFMDPNYLIIIMEYCNAGDLAGLIKKQGAQLLPEKHIMFLFVQICLAMHHVHAAGVLHRDLKTSNILANKPSGTATPGNRTPGNCTPTASHMRTNSEAPAASEYASLPLLKLADFGVAKAGCDTEGSMVGTTVGTPHYLSPEMCDGKKYGKKTDVWALGCILYEVACLRKAFEASNIGGIYRKIAAAEYTPLPDCFSSGLKGLVRSLLAKETKDRPSVAEVLSMPYVRQHLGAYLDWARNIPEAQPEVLLASISQSADGALTPKIIPASRMGSQRLPSSPLAHASSAVPGVSSSNQAGSMLPASSPTPARSSPSSTAGPLPDSKPAVRTLQLDSSANQNPSSPAASPYNAPASAAAMPAPLPVVIPPAAPPALGYVQEQLHESAAGTRRTRAISISSTGGAAPAGGLHAATPSPPAQLSAASMAPAQPVPAKPNPFYAAAAAMAAEGSPAVVGSAVMPAAPESLSMLPHKKRLNVGGHSCSLDIWTSQTNEHSSDSLIAAFHNSGVSLLDCTSSGIRRISSATSSPVHTPKSPLGQYMHSWQQDQLQEELRAASWDAGMLARPQQPAAPGSVWRPDTVGDTAPQIPSLTQPQQASLLQPEQASLPQPEQANPTQQEPRSYRSTEETGLPMVPLPWLAGKIAGEPSRSGSADGWLATLVQSLEKLQHASSGDSETAVAAVAAPALQPNSTGAATVSEDAKQPSPQIVMGWDPSMAFISKDSLAAAGLSPAAAARKRTTGELPPSSLQGWLDDDSNLLQMLQKRTTRTSRTSQTGGLPAQLSPLGTGAVPAKALSPRSSFILPPGGAPSTGQFLPGWANSWYGSTGAVSPTAAVIGTATTATADSAAGGPQASADSKAWTVQAGPAAAPSPVGPQKGPQVSLQDCMAVSTDKAPAAAPAVEARSNAQRADPVASVPSWQEPADVPQKQPLAVVPSVNVLAAADSAGGTCERETEDYEEDDVPLAVMVKQCLSGNSFMYSRNGNSVTSSMRGGPNAAASTTQPQEQGPTTPGKSSVPEVAAAAGVAAGADGSAVSSTQNSSEGSTTLDSGQLTDQAEAQILAEQQEVVNRFNAFRKTLGIYPGRTRHCNVTNLMHLKCTQKDG